MLKFLYFFLFTICAQSQIQLYFPENGFDSNDSIEAVVTEFFDNKANWFCEKNPKNYQVTRYLSQNLITIRAFNRPQESCGPLRNSWKTSIITLGELKSGLYTVQLMDHDQIIVEKKLKITEAQTFSLNTKNYAPISEIQILNIKDNKIFIRLIGLLTESCETLEPLEEKNIFFENSVLTILPTVRRMNNECSFKLNPFKIDFEYSLLQDQKLPILIHSRNQDKGVFAFTGTE